MRDWFIEAHVVEVGLLGYMLDRWVIKAHINRLVYLR